MPAPGRVIWHACVVILASAAVPIWSRALNDVDACESKKIYILDLGMYGADNGMPSCDVTKASTVTISLCPPSVNNGYAIMWTQSRQQPVIMMSAGCEDRPWQRHPLPAGPHQV